MPNCTCINSKRSPTSWRPSRSSPRPPGTQVRGSSRRSGWTGSSQGLELERHGIVTQEKISTCTHIQGFGSLLPRKLIVWRKPQVVARPSKPSRALQHVSPRYGQPEGQPWSSPRRAPGARPVSYRAGQNAADTGAQLDVSGGSFAARGFAADFRLRGGRGRCYREMPRSSAG